MCWECDNPGGDYAAHMIEVIDRAGWGIGGVEPNFENPGWLYTIGLPVTLGHAELLMRPGTLETADVLNAIAHYIQESGRTINPGETMELGDRLLVFGAVSRARRRAGELAGSEEVLRRLGKSPSRAIEVLLMPDELQRCEACFDHDLQLWLRGEPPAA